MELKLLSMELSRWKPLARRLGFKRAKIKAIDANYRRLAEKVFKVLSEWSEESDATYQVLCDALCHGLVGLRSSAEKFCCLERTLAENLS